MSRYHCRMPAAESITPMKCHIPGTAWQKACSLPTGSIKAEGVVAKTSPLVLTVSPTMPGYTALIMDKLKSKSS